LGTGSLGKTARRILEEQLSLMEAHAERAVRLHQASDVHDLRVALRRYRVALRVFGKGVPCPEGKRLRQRLQMLSRRLSPIRDIQVWHGVLARTVGRRKKPLPADLDQCLKAAEAGCIKQVRGLGQALAGAPFTAARKYARQFQCDQPDGPFLAGQLWRAYKRLLRTGVPPADVKVEEAHALRRRCRRVRYLAEFAEPVLGPVAHKLTHHLKSLSTTLGERHDAEVQTRMLMKLKHPPETLLVMLACRKQEAQHAAEAVFRKLAAPHFKERMRAELRVAKRKGAGK